MKTTYDFHPAADLFPMMDDEAFSALKTDIAKHGQQEDVILLDQQIIDGRNRYRACDELGIEVQCCELENCDDPVAFVLSANLHRRHLTASQRGMIAAKLAKGTQGGDRKSEEIKGSNGPLKIDDAAKLMNVGNKTVKRAKEVLRTGDQETITKVESGKLAVSKATEKKKPRKQPQRPPSEPCDECRSYAPQIEGRGREGHLCPMCFDAWAARVSASDAESYHAPEQQPRSSAVAEEPVKSCSEETRQVGVTHLRAVYTAPIADLIDALAERSTPKDFVTCPAEALDRISQNIAMALATRKDVAEPAADVFARECEASEEQLATPAATAAPDEQFSIERRGDSWFVVLPSGATAGPFNARRIAQEHATKLCICGSVSTSPNM